MCAVGVNQSFLCGMFTQHLCCLLSAEILNFHVIPPPPSLLLYMRFWVLGFDLYATTIFWKSQKNWFFFMFCSSFPRFFSCHVKEGNCWNFYFIYIFLYKYWDDESGKFHKLNWRFSNTHEEICGKLIVWNHYFSH